MALGYQIDGSLLPGVHLVTWKEFINEFGYNVHRQTLLSGLKMACTVLKKHGCSSIYIDGSFVTKKALPNDYDGCWDPTGVDLNGLVAEQYLFVDLRHPRAGQKQVFKGELFPTTSPGGAGKTMLDFFQQSKDDQPKGIIKIDLNSLA